LIRLRNFEMQTILPEQAGSPAHLKASPNMRTIGAQEREPNEWKAIANQEHARCDLGHLE